MKEGGEVGRYMRRRMMCMKTASREALGNVGRMALLCKVRHVSHCLSSPVTLSTDSSLHLTSRLL